jgi:hypothetical protein
MVRKEPFITLLSGIGFISFIIYAAKPSHPILTTLHGFHFAPKQFQRLSHDDTTIFHWSTSNSNEINTVNLQINSTTVYHHELIKEKPLFMFPVKDELMIVYHRVDEEFISYHLQYYYRDGQTYNYNIHSKEISGNLRITRCILTKEKHLLYSRKFDTRLFRLILNALSGNISIPGPLAEKQGRILAYSYLGSSSSDHHVMAVQYLPYEKSVLFQVSVSVFTYSNNDWTKETLWETDLAGLGGDLIDSDNIDFLYFLTNPVIAVSDNEDLVVFVLMEHLFTLYRDENKFFLKTQPVVGLYGSDFDVDYIGITQKNNLNLISIVSEVQIAKIVKSDFFVDRDSLSDS